MGRRYVIAGAGMSADAAAKAVRQQDAEADIVLIGQEADPPVPRPALSKKLWTDPDFTLDDTDLATVAESDARLLLDLTVTGIDTGAHVVTTDDGQRHEYDRLLIATGGHPRRIDGLEPGERVFYYRTIADYHRLRRAIGAHRDVAVVGGGWIGTEIAAALAGEGCDVTLHHPDDVLNGAKFPPALATAYEALFTEAGVTVRGGTRVERGDTGGGGVRLHLDDGTTTDAELVVVGLGIEPASGIAAEAGIEVAEDGGVVVDERLATSAPDVWACGDVAQYPDRRLGRTRVEHVDNATTMGDVAGRIVAGSDETYDHTPFFYSAVFGTRFEAVGTLDSSLEPVVDERPSGSTVVYYLDDGQVAGVLMYDVEEDEDQRDAAREAIGRPGNAEELRGSIL